MIQSSLINPQSIAVIGGSQNLGKPGGKIIENLINSPFSGELFVINPKADEIQGLISYRSIEEAPKPDLAILAIPARFCPKSIEALCLKGTRAFIVLSAGFGELDDAGKELDRAILAILDKYSASLLGPNCIGMIHENHHSVFTTPVPNVNSKGVEFISSSGSTAVFIMEAGMSIGLPFSNVYTVGNALQLKVEDILEYLNKNYVHGNSSEVKMIYIENIADPQKFIQNARELSSKGAKIIALKAGMTDAGNRAASSHTGAMASPIVAVKAMFKKAGVLLCNSRDEMLNTAAILLKGKPSGKNVAIITHAGGAGVLLTDALENGGISVPEIKGPDADKLLSQLFPGSSIKNPIDFLATGTKEQLEMIIDYCDKKFENIEAIAVIFGSPGLFDVGEIYDMLAKKSKSASKPIFPILPSPVNNEKALKDFRDKGNFYFPEETRFGESLSRVFHHDPDLNTGVISHKINEEKIRFIIENSDEGYLDPKVVVDLLKAADIQVVEERYAGSENELRQQVEQVGFPLVMKAVGPVHKSDIGGVELNIKDISSAKEHFERLMGIEGVNKVLIQTMIPGKEVFIGAKKEKDFGHLLMFGMGGIYLEVFKDVQTLLTPINTNEVENALKDLKSYPILKGIRGQKGIDLKSYINIIEKINLLLLCAPEIFEMDLNPLMATENTVIVVDARIRILK